MGSINSIVMKRIGYIQGKEIGTQTDATKWWIFALGTGIPIITSSLGIVPKFFYPLSGERRNQMYTELYERRKKKAEIMTDADEETIAKVISSEFKD